ncbi:MAG TPA: c-type cytochrome [Amaricoccus sp.]|uniref:c-type cytochrome n=1 Tax=Amaricoccus sp. TaxID=1872485 RepID=UPI002CAF4505|nr:c-type cytochrome [Amaricoccus sp.]HMQ92296.1 c-type cytochrome [Amaricoccus sp.]HMR51037.1 c-type cytochrome [Amaricoccus sp.]HMR61326.1 c-type cytochrome [Amaricoccus sp.]HMT97784.1 c-type cytochrome [Amaricoccus sp.]
MGGRIPVLAAAALCGAIGLAVVILLARLPDEQGASLLAWDDTAAVSRGQALYATHCAACHGQPAAGSRASSAVPAPSHGLGGTMGSGSSPALAAPHDASGHSWQHPDYALIQLTKSGQSDATCRVLEDGAMPKFGQTLSDREIIDILSYIKSTWPEEVRAKNDAINRLYRGQNAAVRDFLAL